MMTYPKTYAPIAEEEMEYINGGINIFGLKIDDNIALTVGGAAGVLVCGAGTAVTYTQTSEAVRKTNPDKYNNDQAALFIDTMGVYLNSVVGALLTIGDVASVGVLGYGIYKLVKANNK